MTENQNERNSVKRKGGRPKSLTAKKKKEFFGHLSTAGSFAKVARQMGFTLKTLYAEFDRDSVFKRKAYEKQDEAKRGRAASVAEDAIDHLKSILADSIEEKQLPDGSKVKVSTLSVNELVSIYNATSRQADSQSESKSVKVGMMTKNGEELKGIMVEYVEARSKFADEVEEPQFEEPDMIENKKGG